jgi:hypothetical protein
VPEVSLWLRLRSKMVAVAIWGAALTLSSAAAVESALPAALPAVSAPATGDGHDADAVEIDAFSAASWTDAPLGTLDHRVLALALSATRCAATRGDVSDPSTLTIIDYSKASIRPRLWVLDLDERALLYEELVAHGQGSGGNFATAFSNTPDSHQTSLGLFRTNTTYVGRNGYSLRLDGLEPGFNDRAEERAIVMHGAPYVDPGVSKALGRLGRSHGCPAVRAPIARELIDRVKGGSLVFAYYPDARWLNSSTFLNGDCAAR